MRELRQTIAALLKQEPGAALCDACLAFACSASLLEVRAITESLVRESGGLQRASTCASCRRTVPTTFYRRGLKCVQCSDEILSDSDGVVIEDQAFHVHCLRRLITDETDRVVSYQLRQKDPKRQSVIAFKSLYYRVIAAGASARREAVDWTLLC